MCRYNNEWKQSLYIFNHLWWRNSDHAFLICMDANISRSWECYQRVWIIMIIWCVLGLGFEQRYQYTSTLRSLYLSFLISINVCLHFSLISLGYSVNKAFFNLPMVFMVSPRHFYQPLENSTNNLIIFNGENLKFLILFKIVTSQLIIHGCYVGKLFAILTPLNYKQDRKYS